MEILRIIAAIFGIVAYFAMLIYTLYSFDSLRKLKKEVKDIRFLQPKILASITAIQLKDNCKELENMSRILARLVEAENFEEAKKLKARIEETAKDLQESIKDFNERFEGIAQLEVCKISLP